MKKLRIVSLLIIIIAVLSCSDTSSETVDSSSEQTVTTTTDSELPEGVDSGDWRCGIHNGKQLYTGPRGGCYYINSNDNKTYVDRSECNC